MDDWWTHFFAGPYLSLYGPLLDDGQTRRQVDAVWRWLGLQPGERVLDLCCGQGRHAVVLAERGLIVTGLDLMPSLLAKAAAAAAAAGVSVSWRQADMRQIGEEAAYDAVLNLYTAFGYFPEDDDNVAVLRAVSRALKPEGRFLIDLDNREVALAGGDRQRLWEPQGDGTYLLEERRYDVLTGRLHIGLTRLGSDPAEASEQRIRLYSLPELVHLLRGVGMAVTGVWGDYDGSPYSLHAPRLILRAVTPDLG